MTAPGSETDARAQGVSTVVAGIRTSSLLRPPVEGTATAEPRRRAETVRIFIILEGKREGRGSERVRRKLMRAAWDGTEQ